MKNLLVFGASGYVGGRCCSYLGERYNIVKVNRSPHSPAGLCLDFLNPDYDKFLTQLGSQSIDAVLFAQGINPRSGFHEINDIQFEEMLRINLVTPTILLQKMNENNLASNASVIFLSSIAKEKGSYDPSYAAAKSALAGLQLSLAKASPHLRFNILSLGLVGGSPVQKKMTSDFLNKHLNAMNGRLVNVEDICRAVGFLIECESISTHDIKMDCGFRL